MLDSTLPIPTLDLETLDLDALVEQAWSALVAGGSEPRDRESWELGYRMAMVGVLMPLVEKRLGLGESE